MSDRLIPHAIVFLPSSLTLNLSLLTPNLTLICNLYMPPQIQCQITPHAIVFLPSSDGMEMLLCYEDEGVYVNTYGRIIKDVVLQWGEMPTSVGTLPPNL